MTAGITFEIMSESDRRKCIDQAFRILEVQGADVHSEKALGIFEKGGCEVDGIRVKFPRKVVEAAIESAPGMIDIYDRNGEKKMNLGGKNTYFGPGPTCPNYFDPETGERRLATKEDAATTARLSDALPNIDFVMSLVMIGDKVKVVADVHEIDAMVRNTTKPLAGWAFNGYNCQAIIDMCAAVAGGLKNLQDKPFIMVYCEPQTPFVHNKDALDVLMTLAENRIPVIYTPGMILGATTPMTVAGACSVGLCDCFVGLVLSQLINPGTPFIGGASGGPMDMQTMQHCYGAPEFVQSHNVSAEVFHTLDIPVFDIAGASDSKAVDGQSSAETMMQIIGALGVGGNLTHDVGFMDGGLTGSPLQLVFSDELIGMGRRLMSGVAVDEEHLAEEAILEVGPAGNFVTSMHTLEFYQENWVPTLMDRRPYGDWYQSGALTMTDRAQAKMRKLLATHTPEPLSEDIAAQLDEIVSKAEKAEHVVII